MADMKSSFEQASKDIQSLAERPDNDTLLRLYALYKQGSEGDVRGDKPGRQAATHAARFNSRPCVRGDMLIFCTTS